MVEQYPDCITWMPAHCNSSAVGIARLSSGEALTRDDLWANAYVDGLAKDVAKKIAPSRKIRDHITKTSQLIEDVARWIGQITVLANHYTFHNQDGTKSIIRDSDGKRCKPRFVKPVLAHGSTKRKRELASPNSLDSMMETPSFSACTALADAGRKLPAPQRHALCIADSGRKLPATTSRKVTHKDFVDRDNALFHAHWRASRDLKGQLASPPISATDRLKALRERILAKKENSGRDPA